MIEQQNYKATEDQEIRKEAPNAQVYCGGQERWLRRG